MQALHDVVKAGWVRYIGMSSCHAYQCTFLPFTRHGHSKFRHPYHYLVHAMQSTLATSHPADVQPTA